MKYLIAVSAILFSATTFAGQVGTLNSFSPNTTASSSDVNQNFNDIKTEVNDNDTAIGVNAGDITGNDTAIGVNTGNITSNDTAIGVNAGDITTNETAIGVNAGDITTNETAIGVNAGEISGNAANILTNTNNVTAITTSRGIGVYSGGIRRGSFVMFFDNGMADASLAIVLLDSGYITHAIIDGSVGTLERIAVFYTTTDCSGQTYKLKGSTYANSFHARQGIVYRAPVNDIVGYRYLPAGSSSEIITSASIRQAASGACNLVTGDRTVYEVLPNDSNITGITGAEFTGVTLGQ